MNANPIDSKFAKLGARVKIGAPPVRRGFASGTAISLNIQSDRQGEFFEILQLPGAEVEVSVLDVQPADRHLLLLVRENGEKHKYLCGHDERHWFVAGIPDRAPVGTVKQAKEALKPDDVRIAEGRTRLRGRARGKRKNAAFIRQGEWFFLPVPEFVADNRLVLCNEPLVRGGGKPHWVDFCYRTGGETVYTCSRHPNGVTAEQHQRILQATPGAKRWPWRVMQRNPGVYARGRVRHADHKTIMLHDWHRVLMNTESKSSAMRHVAFLD